MRSNQLQRVLLQVSSKQCRGNVNGWFPIPLLCFHTNHPITFQSPRYSYFVRDAFLRMHAACPGNPGIAGLDFQMVPNSHSLRRSIKFARSLFNTKARFFVGPADAHRASYALKKNLSHGTNP